MLPAFLPGLGEGGSSTAEVAQEEVRITVRHNIQMLNRI